LTRPDLGEIRDSRRVLLEPLNVVYSFLSCCLDTSR
jgi:hypothetical protein